MLGERRSCLGVRREKCSKIKATITKRWSEFCWAAVWLQPAAGEEVQRKDFCVFWTQCLLPGAISDERFRCLVHPEPRPRLPAVTGRDLGSIRAWGREGSERRGERRMWWQ